jgi:hypothetical protein
VRPGQTPGTNPARQADATATPKPPTQTETQRRQTIYSQTKGWGDLPKRDRERILQIPPEEFLPKYQKMIEDYYRQLSRQPGDDESPAGDNQGPEE